MQSQLVRKVIWLRWLWVLSVLAASAAGAQNVLNNSDHAQDIFMEAIGILNGGLPAGVHYDQTCMTDYSTSTPSDPNAGQFPTSQNGCDFWNTGQGQYNTNTVGYDTLLSDSYNSSASFWAAGTSTPVVNNQPYQVADFVGRRVQPRYRSKRIRNARIACDPV